MPKYGSGPYSEGGDIHTFATSAAVGICIFCHGRGALGVCAKAVIENAATANAKVFIHTPNTGQSVIHPQQHAWKLFLH